MHARKEPPELVFSGKVEPWYQLICAAATIAAAVLALQTSLPFGVPLAVLAVSAFLLWPAVFRNRVELYADRAEVVFGWARVTVPYDHVRDVRRAGPVQLSGHVCMTALDGIFIEAPEDGDALVSVQDNDALVAELRRRCGLKA